jgi:hypothetical protein
MKAKEAATGLYRYLLLMAYTGTLLLLLILIFKVGFLITELKSKQTGGLAKSYVCVCLQMLQTDLHKPE